MPDRPFFLYLRSFASDKPTTETWKLTGRGGDLVRKLWHASPKEALELLLEPAGPLIEIGGDRHFGMGQVRVADADWWASAVELMIHSTANFLNPGATGGLAREADFILAHRKLARRTFLVMEPTHETMLSASFRKNQVAAADRQKRWREIVAFYRRRRIDLPDYDARGAIISLFAPIHRDKFTGISRYRLYDLMHKMYIDLNKRGSYDLSPGEPCPCGSGKTFADCHAVKAPGPP
jgi:SEC-C motif